MTNSHNKLLLLFGMPRSGTTWIGKLFDSHKDTLYLHEPDSVKKSLNIPLLMSHDNNQSQELQEQIDLWLQNDNEKVIASLPLFKKSYMNEPQWLTFYLSCYASKAISRSGLPIPVKPIHHHNPAKLTVWKSIESLGRMSEIKKLTSARSVHILRHPCGHIASTINGEMQHNFFDRSPVWEDWDLFEKLLEQSRDSRFRLKDIQRMDQVEALTVRWGLINDFALANNPGDDNQVLLYENLCAKPEGTLRELMAFAGLEYTQENQEYINSSTTTNNKAYYATDKLPLEAANKWRHTLSEDDIAIIESVSMMFKCGEYYQGTFQSQSAPMDSDLQSGAA
ncbi:sulfotransferase [Pseudomaricurvus sp.]|uniref:sulfotransferase n=1 Tax=Pseudomaricurvus sp. TaxID=2004510 RepID=UPI003F6B88A7